MAVPSDTVGRHQAGVNLRGEPLFELVHQRLALRLGVRQARLGAQCIRARRLVVVEPLADHLTHPWHRGETLLPSH